MKQLLSTLMGNSHRREGRRRSGDPAAQAPQRGGAPRRDRFNTSNTNSTASTSTSTGGTGGARTRSSTQPARSTTQSQRPQQSGQRLGTAAPANNSSNSSSSGSNQRQTASAPQWVTTGGYSQAQTLVGAEVQESKSIKNHANLNKLSLNLVPARDGRFRIRFRADCRVEAEVCIYLATREIANPEYAGVRFEPQHPRFANAVLPPHKLPAETDCTYTSPSINVRNYWKYLKYRPHQPHDYPIVISMSYKISDDEWEAYHTKSKAEEEGKKDGENKAVPEPEKRMQSQYTYAEVVRTAHDDKPTEYGLKVLKQRLQVGNDLYDLEDIYGMPAEGGARGETTESSVEPVTASLAGVEDGHEDGEECVICLAEPRNTLVMPCRHMCLCADCASMLRQRTNKCPICRTVAERFLTFKKSGEKAEIDDNGKDDSDSEGEVDFNKPVVHRDGSKSRSKSASPGPSSSSSSQAQRSRQAPTSSASPSRTDSNVGRRGSASRPVDRY